MKEQRERVDYFDVRIDPDFLLTFNLDLWPGAGIKDCLEHIIASDISYIDLNNLVLNLDCQPFTAGDHPWPSWSGWLV